MFKYQYKDTIYALYKNSPKHTWFFELVTQLDRLFVDVNLDTAIEKQHAYHKLLCQYESHDLYQRLSNLYVDIAEFSLSDQTLDLPCGPGGLHLYYNHDFTLSLLASEKMPEESSRFFSLAHNTSILCLDGTISIQRWPIQKRLVNECWDTQFSSTKLLDKESILIESGEFFETDCRSAFAKFEPCGSFVAISLSTRPLLDIQIEFDPTTLKPVRMIDASSDKSQCKVFLKILPMLSQNGCEVDDIIELGLASENHTIRWEAIKASVLTESPIAEQAVLNGLNDSSDDVRQACHRLVAESLG